MNAESDRDGVPSAGAIVTFVRRDSAEPVPIGSGIVVGPAFPDLDTGRWWVGVRLPAERPGREPGVDLIDAGSIVDSIPPRWERPVW